MLGTIRFFLAILVLTSHLPHYELKPNLGVVSVICFYFISGFFMNKSYSRFERYATNPALDFYIDRCIKIFPQYLIVAVFTVVGILSLGKSEVIDSLNQDITLSKIILNMILIPANYVFYPLAIKALNPGPIIPPAWSLATEFHFYLILPFISKMRKQHWLILILITMGIQFSSFFFSSAVFNANNFGYRYIFGVLTIFLYGYAFAEKKESFYKKLSILIWITFAMFLFFIAPLFNIWKNKFVLEILLGGFIALPLGYVFTSVRTKSESVRKFDNLLGNLAYPIFISHFFSFYLVEKILTISISDKVNFYISSVILCLIVSLALNLFHGLVEEYRIKRRGFKSMKEVAPNNT